MNKQHWNPSSDSIRGLLVLIRGAGELATGAAHRLARSGLSVVMTEIANPLAVRRAVSFCEAVHDGSKTVEGLTARLVAGPDEALDLLRRGELPVLVDPEMNCLEKLRPPVVVDALLAKRNTGLRRDMAQLTIGMGPGFKAPDQVHLAIETNRGHNLGRLIYQGEPAPNTGVPGAMAGHTVERVLRSPADGVFQPQCQLGDRVEKGQLAALIDGHELRTKVGGIVRGLIRPGAKVTQGLKVGDVDPRGEIEYLNTISEKARALGGSVLEGVMAAFNR